MVFAFFTNRLRAALRQARLTSTPRAGAFLELPRVAGRTVTMALIPALQLRDSPAALVAHDTWKTRPNHVHIDS